MSIHEHPLGFVLDLTYPITTQPTKNISRLFQGQTKTPEQDNTSQVLKVECAIRVREAVSPKILNFTEKHTDDHDR